MTMLGRMTFLGPIESSAQYPHLAKFRNRRQQSSRLVVPGWRKLGETFGGSHEHCVSDAPRAHRQDTQTHSGEDVRVVGLIYRRLATIPTDRSERAAGTDERPPISPLHQVLRRRLRARRGI